MQNTSHRVMKFMALARQTARVSSVRSSQQAFVGSLSFGSNSIMQMPIRNFAYHQNVLDHYENPRNIGSLDKKDKNVGTGLVGAPACGDVMKLQI